MVTLATLYNDFKTLIKQNFYDKDEVDDALSDKQDTLVSGTSIKTINNNSLLGSGNITISGSGTVDSSLSTTSTNPVQNQAITNEINSLNTSITNLNTTVNDHTTTFTNMIEIRGWSIDAFSLSSGSGVQKKVTVPNPSGYYRIPFIQGAYKCYASSLGLSGTTLTVNIQNHYSTNANASMYGKILYIKSSIITEI